MLLFPPQRVRDAQAATAAAGLDALLLSPGADLRYLTGYDAHQLERLTLLVLPAEGEPTLIVPTLERPAAEASPAPDTGIRVVDHADGSDPYPLVRQALNGSGPVGLALDGGGPVGLALDGGGPVGLASDGAGPVGLANHMWAEHVLALRDALPGREQRLASEVLSALRMRKSPAEVDALRRAGAAIDAVHRSMGDWLRPGRTEAEVAADIAAAILDAGHATVEFTIVAAGPNGASPHHGTSDRKIAEGEPVVVDIGGKMPDGYCSDSTRVYVVGTPPAEFNRAYDALYAAQRAAVAVVKPGVPAEAVDAVARDLLTEHGYGEQFLHRTGHGIGLDAHEDPYIVAGNEQPLEPGMAFSIEPGVYLAGRFGARIEDIVVCTADGVERLNTIPTELVQL